MKKCPYCAEEIQDEAVKCRFCNEFIRKRKWWNSCLVGCLIAFIVCIVLLFLFLFFSFLILKFFVYKIFFEGSHPQNLNYGTFGFWRMYNMPETFIDFFRQLWDKLMELWSVGIGVYPRNA